MRLYLGTFIGTGTDLDPFRPSVDGDFSIIDLRADVTQQAGRCLVATPVALPSVPTGWRDLGEDLDAALNAPTRNFLGNALGLTVEAVTPRAILAELLLLHARVDGTRWRPLKANRLGRHRIVMLSQVLFDAPVIQGVVITDDFTRANADALGSSSEGWSWTEAVGDIDIVSNAAEVMTLNASVFARAESSLASDDHYAQADVLAYDTDSGAGRTSAAGLLLRYHTSDVTHYLGRYLAGASQRWEIFRIITASATSIATQADTAPTAPYTMRFEVDGSALEIFHDDVSQLATTDTNITGNLRTGVREFQGPSNLVRTRLDNFEASDLLTLVSQIPNATTSNDGWDTAPSAGQAIHTYIATDDSDYITVTV